MLTATPITLRTTGSIPVAASSTKNLPARAPAGSWRYRSAGISRSRFAIAIVVSAGVHVGILFGLGHQRKVVHRVAEEVVPVIGITIPQLKELEDLDPIPSEEKPVNDVESYVPMQADVPRMPSPSDFVQQLDYASLIERPDIPSAKIAVIPEHILRGGKLAEGFGAIFNISDLDRVPEPVMQTPPVYPNAMKREASIGTVRLEFIVDSNGRVVNPFVVESSNPGFDDAAILGVSKWKFRAGIRAGRKVNTRMQVPIIFKLSDPIFD